MIIYFVNRLLKTLAVCFVLLLFGCRPSPDFDALRREILDRADINFAQIL